MRTRWILLLSLLSLALGGCGGSSQVGVEQPTELPIASATLTPAQPTQGDNTQMNPSLSTATSSGLEGLIEMAKENLAQRLSIPTSDISLVEAKGVTWSDGSLGCPQAGMAYAQVLTPGYLIKLKYDGRDFEYHAGKDRSFTYCENPLPSIEGTPDNT